MKTINEKYDAFNKAMKELHDAVVERIGKQTRDTICYSKCTMN